MRYEEKILIQICKGEKIADLDYSSVDWNNLLVQSVVHKVVGALYSQFYFDVKVPQWFRELIRHSYYFQKDSGTHKLNEFQTVLKALQENGISVIVLKGVYLAPYVYGDLGVRKFSDMDILIQESERKKAIEIIKDSGYVQGEYSHETDKIIPVTQETIDERHSIHQHDSEFIKVTKTTATPLVYTIELHTRLETVFDETKLNTDQLFKNKIRYSFDDSYAYRLSNEDMLIYLCYHNYWHTQSLKDVYCLEDILLRNYMDIRLIVKKNVIDWGYILKEKGNEKLWFPISYSLYFCHVIFGDVLPQEVLKEFDCDYIETEERNIYDRWISKRRGRKALGQYPLSFMERVFNLNRYQIAFDACDFSEYSKFEDVQDYFKFYTNDHKIYRLEEINKKHI